MTLDLLIYTHSSCRDVLSIFLSQLKRCTENAQECRIVLLTDDENSANRALRESGVENFIIIQYSDSTPYSQHFEELQGIISEFFLYMQEDFFIVSDWDYTSLNHYVNLIRKLDLALIRLTPSGSYRSKAYLESFRKKSKLYFDGQGFMRIDYLSSLPACMQPTIWRTSEFLKMHRDAKIENIRDEWSDQYRTHFKKNKLIGLATEKVEIPYLEVTAVRKGKWNFTDFNWGTTLQQILLEYNINPLVRGISTYKFNVREKRSGFMRDLWRRIRYMS